uniref:TonB C-terminal domain-containing protein n=1 Tax=uncultured bacterium A1Q1_fos_504 TaxID=1256580 RepID=L7VZZ1_9BACT|nr:hypothetical protein [uncultured bacterium A1Q1_fos_504]
MNRICSRFGAAFTSVGAFVVLTACSAYPRIDTRPVEQRLADRPIPKFSEEDVRAFAESDRSKPYRLKSSTFMRSCGPDAPPVRAMYREKTNRVDGVIEAVVQPSGLISDVYVVQLVPEGTKPEVEATFRQSLTTAPCRFPSMQTALRIEIPFRMILD